MHTYLRYQGQIIDITFPKTNKLILLEEEQIVSTQLGEYNINKHKNFIKHWLLDNPKIKFNTEEIWKIREKYIVSM